MKFNRGELPLDRPQLTISFFQIQTMDADNLRGSGKIVIDALKEDGGCGLIRDDSPEDLPAPIYRQEKVMHRKEEHVEVDITVTE
jgi:hypothetical protein